MHPANRKVSSRNSNKENRPRESLNVPRFNHCKIDMTKEALVSSTCSGAPKSSKAPTPVNLTTKNSLERLHIDSFGSSVGRQQLTKSSSKLGKPRDVWFPSTTKNCQKSLPKKEQSKSKTHVSLRGILNNALIDISKMDYKGIHKGLDNLLGQCESQANLSDRQTIGFIRLIIQKIHQKSQQHEREREDAIQQANQMSSLFKQQLKRKNKQLLWLKQQVQSRSHPTYMIERQDNSSRSSATNISDYSICYQVEPTQSCKTLDDEMKTKLKLDFNKIKEYRQSEEYLNNISD